MIAPGFWAAERPGWLAGLLAPLGFLYGHATLSRMARPGAKVGVPVISIGNFTAGGAGKTPAALAIASTLIARGETPAFVTRGYGGRVTGPHRVTGTESAAEVGDEPLLLARIAPTIVSRDRVAGARLAIETGASLVILDDALQNPGLAKDISIAVVDGASGFGNGRVIPAGPLRAPVEGQLPHVALVLILGEDQRGIAGMLGGKPVVTGRIVPGPLPALAGAKVLAFSGIALPAKFEASLRECGAEIVAARHFADHHVFTDAEAGALIAEAETKGLPLVTTEKDFVRLTGSAALLALREKTTPLPIRLEADPGLFVAVYRALERSRSR